MRISLLDMARAIADIELEIRTLSREDKERLLRSLVAELDGTSDSDVDQAWLEEIRRRSREIDKGHVNLISADQVFAEARAAFVR